MNAIPEKRLLAAILARAIVDYLGDRRDDNKALQLGLPVWLFRSEEEFSFKWICDHLELDPIALRNRLRQWKQGNESVKLPQSMVSLLTQIIGVDEPMEIIVRLPYYRY
jgi:hypothetical protein